MARYYGTEGAGYGLGTPGWYNSVPTELHGQIRLAHDSFELDAGDIAIPFNNPDVISLNSILIPKACRVVGGFLIAAQLSNVSGGSVRINLGLPAADMTSATPIFSMVSDGAVADLTVDGSSPDGDDYHSLVPYVIGTGPYTDRLPASLAVWLAVEVGTVTTVLSQSAAKASIGIYYVT